MDIFKVDICIGSIIDFIGFDTISISFLVTANWFFSHSHFMNIKGNTFFSKFYSDISVYSEAQLRFLCRVK